MSRSRNVLAIAISSMILTTLCWDDASIEPDRRARYLRQIVGEPSDASPHEAVQVDLMHSIERRMPDLGEPALDEGSMEKSMRSQTAIGGIVAQGDQAPHVVELEFVQRLTAGDMPRERAGEKKALLASDLRRGRQRPSVPSSTARTVPECEDAVVVLRLQRRPNGDLSF